MSYARTYARHAALSVGNTVLTGALFYALRIMLYQRLDTREYAWFYSAMALIMVMQPILTLGFDPGLAPFVTRFREGGRYGALRALLLRIAAIQSALGVGCAALVALFAPQLSAALTGGEGAAPALRVLGVYLAAMLLYKVAITALLGLQAIAARTAIEFARAAGIAAGAYFFVHEAAAEAAVAYAAATGAAACIGLAALPYLRPALLRSDSEPQTGLTAAVFHSGKYASIAFGGVTIFSQMDTLMLGFLRPGNEAAVASYQVAAPTFMVLYSLLMALTVNFMPMATQLQLRGEFSRLGRGVTDMQRMGARAILPLAGCIAAFSEVLIETLFRRDAPGADVALAILVAGGYWSYSAYLLLNTLAGIGRTRDAALVVVAGLAANLVLNGVLVPLFNLAGAALATALATGVTAVYARHRLAAALPLPSLGHSVWSGALLGITGFAVGAGLTGTALYEAAPLAMAAAWTLGWPLMWTLTLWRKGSWIARP